MALGGLLLALMAVSGCRRRVAYQPPPTALPPPPRISVTPVPRRGVSEADLRYVATHRPIFTEVGLASWYQSPYRGRRAANGQVFRNSAMTAANRTLPMGSLVVVTNLTTGQSAAVSINDRGPFVKGRIVDLSEAAAKAVGIYRIGVARVELALYKAPEPIWSGGLWCVQIGAFRSRGLANKYKRWLLRRYPRSDVIEFPGERSYWVRISPEGDNRTMAEYLARHLHPPQGHAFLTRLD